MEPKDRTMKYVLRGPNEGKTTTLLDWARGHPNHVMIFPQERMARSARDVVRDDPEFSDSQFVSVGRLKERRWGPDTKLGIDELDSLLRYLLGADVEIVTGRIGTFAEHLWGEIV